MFIKPRQFEYFLCNFKWNKKCIENFKFILLVVNNSGTELNIYLKKLNFILEKPYVLARKISLIILLFCCSCNNSKDFTKSYYPNGNIKIIYFKKSNKSFDSIIEFYNNNSNSIKSKLIKQDSNYKSISFYKNGKIFKEGNLTLDSLVIGKWNYYNDEGILSDTREFFNIRNKQTLNQIWYFNKQGDTVFTANDVFNSYGKNNHAKINKDSHFMNLVSFPKPKDTVKVNEPLSYMATLITPIYGEKSFSRVYLLDSLNQVKSNKVYHSLLLDSINQEAFPSMKSFYNDCVLFGVIYRSPGKKRIKGYLAEFMLDSFNVEKTKEHEVNRIYFDMPIFVTE